MPIVTQIFLDIYGWRGTLLLLGGMCCHIIPCAGVLFNSDMATKSPKPHEKHKFVETGTCTNEKPSDKNSISHYNNFVNTVATVLCNPLYTNVSFMAQILIPSMVCGYIYTGWLIYIVSFAVSNGASMREASIVGTCGGIGLTAIRSILSLLNQMMTYKHLIYISSILSAISLALSTVFTSFMGMCFMSVIFGAGFGIIGPELYIAMKEITTDDKYLLGVAYANMIHGFTAIASGFFTGEHIQKARVPVPIHSPIPHFFQTYKTEILVP